MVGTLKSVHYSQGENREEFTGYPSGSVLGMVEVVGKWGKLGVGAGSGAGKG